MVLLLVDSSLILRVFIRTSSFEYFRKASSHLVDVLHDGMNEDRGLLASTVMTRIFSSVVEIELEDIPLHG